MNKATSRRTFASQVALGSIGMLGAASASRAAGTSSRYLNFFISGPFAFVVHTGRDPHVEVLAPCIAEHSIAVLTTSLSEAPVPPGTWALVLPDAPSSTLQASYASGSHVVDLKKEGLEVDPRKERYLALRLPIPEFLSPIRPVEIQFGGTGPYVSTPVGLVARFKLGPGTQPVIDKFKPTFSPAEGDQVSLFLDYRPAHVELDTSHTHAQMAFASLTALFRKKGMTAALKMSLKYKDEPPLELGPCDKPDEKNPTPLKRRNGPGHNCRSPILVAINPD